MPPVHRSRPNGSPPRFTHCSKPPDGRDEADVAVLIGEANVCLAEHEHVGWRPLDAVQVVAGFADDNRQPI
jgi:hypothetical protein